METTRLSLLGLFVILTGCAGNLAATREQRLHRLAGNYIYQRPLEEVWPEARRLLEEAGYQTMESADAYEMVTDWNEVVGGSIAKVWVRYMVYGERLDGDTCVVRFTRAEIDYVPSELRSTVSSTADSPYQTSPLKTSTPLGMKLRFKKMEGRTESGTHQSGGRDLGMEWALLKRTSPEVAAKMEQMASRP